MPRRVMKIDHVHDWDADRVQWAMIVGYVLIEIGEIIAQLQRVSRSKNVARDLYGRIWRNRPGEARAQSDGFRRSRQCC